ncbi:MAG: stage II sporulation protein R [Sporolactobacillus sp.]
MKRSGALFLILTINLALLFFFWQGQSTKADVKGPIPQNAIRLRILANSDSPVDQTVKRQVRDAVNQNITQWVQNLKSRDQAEKAIRAHMPELQTIVRQTLKSAHADQRFHIKLGKADFPTKMYGTYVYPAGNYHALVITLGDGKGANWWCVLFPPLCFLDFSNSEAVSAPQTAKVSTTSVGAAGISQEQTQRKPADQNVRRSEKSQAEAGDNDQNSVQTQQSEKKARAAEKQAVQQHGSDLPQAESSSSSTPQQGAEKVKIHFFVADLFSKLWGAIK